MVHYICVDFQALNKITKKNWYPLPLLTNLLDAPQKARVYTHLDLWHAYHLVCIHKGDEHKTAFQTHYGSFEWLVMPIGLTNAPATFQHFVNNIFSDMLNVCVLIYLDDILIYSNSMEEHCKHVWEFFWCLWKHGLYAWEDKCKFHKTELKFLGFILTQDGLKMSQDKVKVILDWPELWKVWDIQSFLGFCNFYQCFIDSYSTITVPLTCLTHKSTLWNPDNKC